MVGGFDGFLVPDVPVVVVPVDPPSCAMAGGMKAKSRNTKKEILNRYISYSIWQVQIRN